MTIKLYYLLASPPARAVELTLKTLKIPYEKIEVDLLKGEQHNEEFLKLNPQHTVPVIVEEDGFTVCDSHAINPYLVNKYAEDDKLYPKDLKGKAIVDHRLSYDCGTLFYSLKLVAHPFLFEKSINKMSQALVNNFVDNYETLERYLSLGTKYIAADHVTIADFSILTTLENVQLFVPIDKEKFPKLADYIKLSNATIPYLEELNTASKEPFKKLFKDFNFQVS